MYPLVRPWLFRLPPETAHRLSLQALQLAGSNPLTRSLVHGALAGPPDPVEVMGLHFSNRVGLAAGYDKDGLGWRGLAAMGFGHVEVGTITPRPQAGNPRPRVFRLPEDRSLINRLGFPGEGGWQVRQRLGQDRPHGVVLGVNLGRNKTTPNEQAFLDYLDVIELFADVADYLVVNVSSPNTPKLRELQARGPLTELLRSVERALAPFRGPGRPLPLLVKLAPDMDEAALDDALCAVSDSGLAGVIATNTTLDRAGLRSHNRTERGGLSGAALTDRSTGVIARIHRLTEGKLPIIGVGGVMSGAHARAKLDAGASLVQVYTGLIYRGPGFVRELVHATR